MLVKARQELGEKMRQQAEIEERIAQLKRMIASIADYVDETPETEILMGIEEPSLKDAIRTALRAVGKAATPTTLRAMLTELRFPIERHVNPIGSIYTVLKRLMADGEVAYGPERDGKKTYVWVLPIYGASGSFANREADKGRDKAIRQKR
jgi:hypothetical protein